MTSKRPPSAAPSSHPSPSVQQLLSERQEQEDQQRRLRSLHAHRAELLTAARAVSDCGHRIPRLRQPAPDRLSPGDDVKSWVEGSLVAAVLALRRLEAQLGQSPVPLLRTSIPSTYMPVRRPYVQVMQDVFIALLESKSNPLDVETAVRDLDAVARASEGEVGAMAQWFDHAAHTLGTAIEAIPLEALGDDGLLRNAANEVFESAILVASPSRKREYQPTRDPNIGERQQDPMAPPPAHHSPHPPVATQTTEAPVLVPLSDEAAAVYETLCGLPDTKGLTASELVRELGERKPPLLVDEQRVKGEIRDELRPRGLENLRRGYFIPMSRRPPPR